MPATSPPGVKPPPIILTPPTGARTRPERKRRTNHRTRRADVLAFVRGAPTAAHFAGAAILYWLTYRTVTLLRDTPLHNSGLLSTATYLTWAGSSPASSYAVLMLGTLTWIPLAAAVLLLSSALVPNEPIFAPLHVVARRLYKYAFALPLWTVLVAGLDRFTTNEVYDLARIATWNLTPVMAKIEAPLIVWLQRVITSNALTTFASVWDSAIWWTPIVLAGLVVVIADRPRTLNALIVAYVLALLLAVPLFVLAPVFAPWTTNALYGARDATHISFLSGNLPAALLTRINTDDHVATGLVFPNLHIGIPLVGALVLRRQGLRAASLAIGGLAVVTAFVGVYLGRTWIIGAAAAIPYSMAVAALARRLPLDIIIRVRTPAGQTLRPGEIAVPIDPRVDAARWMSGIFFIAGFAALLDQLVWQRVLAGIVGLTSESITLVVSVLLLGLGAGVLLGGAVSRRVAKQLPLVFAGMQGAIGLFSISSIALFAWVDRATLDSPPIVGALVISLMLLPPTMLIGATFPLLLMQQVRAQRNIGAAVGRLYFMATLGAGTAAGAAALLLFGLIGQRATLFAAVLLNVGVGALVFARSRRVRSGF